MGRSTYVRRIRSEFTREKSDKPFEKEVQKGREKKRMSGWGKKISDRYRGSHLAFISRNPNLFEKIDIMEKDS